MSKSCKRALLAAVGAGALLGGPGLGWAQDGGLAEAQPETEAAAEVEAVVVTAQRREQAIQDVPINVVAYNGEFLDRIGVTDLEELSAFTPGLLVQNQSPNNPGFNIRGLTSDSGEATNEPRVSVYQDGVSISKSRGSYVELFDVERVEVAKGPQSTLFGRGALIGAINIIQNKARIGGDWEGSAAAYAGEFGYARFDLAINAPLGERAALRLAGRQKARDGYVDNLLGGEDFNGFETRAYRLSFAAEPIDGLRIDLIANYQTDEAPGTAFKSRTFLPADPETGRVLGDFGVQSGAALTSGTYGDPVGLEREVYGLTALAEYGLTDALTFNSVTAYRKFDSSEVFDADGFGLPVLVFDEEAQGKQFSQEFRLAYEGEDRVSGFIGLNYFKEDGFQAVPGAIDERLLLALFTGSLDGSPTMALPNALPQPVLSSIPLLAQQLIGLVGRANITDAQAQGIANNLAVQRNVFANSSETQAVDLFADATLAITPRLFLTGGLRYTTSDKTSGYRNEVATRSILGGVLAARGSAPAARAAILSGLAVPGAATIPQSAAFPLPLFGTVSQPTANNGDEETSDLSEDQFTYRLVGRFEVSDRTSLYASYARGRRPSILAVAAPAAPFGPVRFSEITGETVDNYELGAKTYLPAQRLTLDGSVFLYQYSDFQTNILQGAMVVTTNAGEAEGYGFEGQANWRPSDRLTLFATYGFNHSELTTGLFSGNTFRLAPEHKASFGLTGRLPFAGGEVFVTPTYLYQSEVFFADNNDRPELQAGGLFPDRLRDEVQEGYSLLNLRLGYEPASGRWRVEAFADNILDEAYIKDAGNTGDGFGIPTFIAGEPRMIGVGFTLRTGS